MQALRGECARFEGTSWSPWCCVSRGILRSLSRIPSQKRCRGVWKQALAYERALSGRTDDEILGPENPAATGNDQGEREPMLTVRDSLRVMLGAVGEGLRTSREGTDAESCMAWRKDASHAFLFAPELGVGNAGYAYAFALAVQQRNAQGQEIVAAPTAGACGIVPAALFAAALREEEIQRLGREFHLDLADIDKDRRTRLEQAVLTAAMVGLIINNIVPTSGATHGCQAETGIGAAMAAAAVCAYQGGTNKQICHAVALALKNVIGLTCDPVAGKVEVPCIKRSAMKAVEALVAGRAAWRGLESRIPADEMVWVLKEAGEAMPVKLRETSLGGLAQTISARTSCPYCGEAACPSSV